MAKEIFWNSCVSGHIFENLLEQSTVKNIIFCVRGKNFHKKKKKDILFHISFEFTEKRTSLKKAPLNQ